MTNPPSLVITGLGGYFILNFLQKSGYDSILSIHILNFFRGKYNKSTRKYTKHTGIEEMNRTSKKE